MSGDDTRMAYLHELHDALQEHVASSSKVEIEQCARVLAMYLALYKEHFGELSVEEYEHLNGDLLENDAGTHLFARGMEEMLEMLLAVSGRAAMTSTPPGGSVN